jgi:hypothetical protein
MASIPPERPVTPPTTTVILPSSVTVSEPPPVVEVEEVTARIAERAVVIDLGSTRRKRIKQLKRGRGKLLERVREAVELAAAGLGEEASDKMLVPTVVLVREKSSNKMRRRGSSLGMCPICCF